MADVFDPGSAPGCQFRPSQTPSLGPIPRPARRVRALTRSGPRERYRPSRSSPRPCYLCLRPSLSLPWRTATPRQTKARPQSARATLSATLRARRWLLPGRMLGISNDEAAHLGLPTSAPKPPKTPTHGRSGLRRSTRNVGRSTIWTRRSTTKPGRGTISTCG